MAGDARDLALDVGVVGGFDEAADQQPMGEDRGDDQCHQGEEDEHAALKFGGHGEKAAQVFQNVANLAVFRAR
ncbi:hypothetical protein D3C78_1877650 [compost metagenome]